MMLESYESREKWQLEEVTENMESNAEHAQGF